MVATVMCVLAACSMRQVPLDPEQVAQEIAAAKTEEIDLVRTTIGEQDRADRFIALLESREQLLARFIRQIADHKARMARLSADYEAQRKDFEAALADYNNQRSIAQTEYIDLLAAMKQTTTAAEWSAISAFQLEQLNPRKLVYGAGQGGSSQ